MYTSQQQLYIKLLLLQKLLLSNKKLYYYTILEMIFISSVSPSVSIMAYNAKHESHYSRYTQHKGLCGLSVFKLYKASVYSDHGRQYHWLRCEQQGASSDSVLRKKANSCPISAQTPLL